MLSVVAGLFEKIIYLQLNEYLAENNILPIHQSGFRKGQSTATSLLRWLPTIPENVKLLRTHSPVTKFILNTPKTGECEYFQEKHEGHCCTYNEK